MKLSDIKDVENIGNYDKPKYDPNDVITLNIPLFIRLLEWAKEDSESDMDLHKISENILNIKDHTLTMADYDSIIIKKFQESRKYKIVDL
jgi:hypothetical protein